MNWIALAFFLELGFIPQDAAIMYEPDIRIVEAAPVFYQKFDAMVELFGFLDIGGSVKIYDWIGKDWKLSFFPERAGFEIGAALRFDPVMIGWRHYCTHPIVPFFPVLKQQMKWEGAYDEIYISVGGEIPWQKR
jgi:hypothetical protein